MIKLPSCRLPIPLVVLLLKAITSHPQPSDENVPLLRTTSTSMEPSTTTTIPTPPSNPQPLSDNTKKETTLDLIRSYGYPAEAHRVQTEDGYILELHRIPHGRGHSRAHVGVKRPVVFLQHCLLCSSSDWVINTPDKALGFILADEGYDVWLGNARGNTYSRNHVELSPSKKEFWNFSLDEIAYYDMPASIDYVLRNTNSPDLNYVGFSMGTTVFFAMLSERPEYNEKVRFMTALGPVAFLENMGGPLALLTQYSGPIKSFTDFVGIYEVLPGGVLLDLMTSILCDPLIARVAPICDNILLRLIGMDTDLINRKLLPKILAHTPAGTSVQNMIHYMQAKNSGRFQMYSFGPSGNRKVYRSKYPPSYDLHKTLVPVALFWAENDWFANPKDTTRLYRLLPNVILNKKVPEKYFSHVDFLWSDSAVDSVYGDILKLLADYNSPHPLIATSYRW